LSSIQMRDDCDGSPGGWLSVEMERARRQGFEGLELMISWA